MEGEQGERLCVGGLTRKSSWMERKTRYLELNQKNVLSHFKLCRQKDEKQVSVFTVLL